MKALSWILDKIIPRKAWGVLAAETEDRGNCYTILVGRLIWFSIPAGMVYEKNKDGTPNKQMDQVTILD